MKLKLLIAAMLAALVLVVVVGEFCYLHVKQKEASARLAAEREESEREQARTLFDSAVAALKSRDSAGAVRLLSAYLAPPPGPPERARRATDRRGAARHRHGQRRRRAAAAERQTARSPGSRRAAAG